MEKLCFCVQNRQNRFIFDHFFKKKFHQILKSRNYQVPYHERKKRKAEELKRKQEAGGSWRKIWRTWKSSKFACFFCSKPRKSTQFHCFFQNFVKNRIDFVNFLILIFQKILIQWFCIRWRIDPIIETPQEQETVEDKFKNFDKKMSKKLNDEDHAQIVEIVSKFNYFAPESSKFNFCAQGRILTSTLSPPPWRHQKKRPSYLSSRKLKKKNEILSPKSSKTLTNSSISMQYRPNSFVFFNFFFFKMKRFEPFKFQFDYFSKFYFFA